VGTFGSKPWFENSASRIVSTTSRPPPNTPVLGAYYQQQLVNGKTHHAAVRALAYKWIRILWKYWQTRTPYNEVKYLASLRKKGSPLLNYAVTNRT
jgi:hypothetical protein